MEIPRAVRGRRPGGPNASGPSLSIRRDSGGTAREGGRAHRRVITPSGELWHPRPQKSDHASYASHALSGMSPQDRGASPDGAMCRCRRLWGRGAERSGPSCAPMPIIRRCAAFITCLLLLQLTILGSQGPCDEHGRGDSTSAASHDRTHSPAPGPSDQCGAVQTPGACASMAACAVTLPVPAPAVTSAALLSPRAWLPDPVSMHPRIAAGPEVPPPRG